MRPGALLGALASLLVALCAPSSCSLLGPDDFAVSSWSPGPGRREAAALSAVRVSFSAEPDRVSAENAFSLSADGSPLSGAFAWDGAVMSFAPYLGFRDGVDYAIAVREEARTPAGVSLARKFEGRFSTKAEDGRPSVAASEPCDGGVLPGRFDRLVIRFNEPVDRASFRGALSLSPAISGVWRLEEGGRSAVFEPLEAWAWGSPYLARVSAELRDESGNNMGCAYEFRFSIGEDRAPPSLAAAEALDPAGGVVAALVALDPSGGASEPNRGWEAGWRLLLRFSEPVSTESLAARVVASAGLALRMDEGEAFREEVTFGFAERPAFGAGFSIRVKSGVEDSLGNATQADAEFLVVADGPGSAPPRLIGVRLPLAPGEPDPGLRRLAAFPADEPFATLPLGSGAAEYPPGAPTASSIELYFELASGASIEPFSLMSSFSLSSTNDALYFSPLAVSPGGLAYAEPYGPWAGYAVARVDGLVTNRVASGVVSLRLAVGLRDSAGNAAPLAQTLPFLK